MLRQQERHIVEEEKIKDDIKSLGASARKNAEARLEVLRDSRIFNKAVSKESLTLYLMWRWPHLSENERVEKIFLDQVNVEKYKSIKDVNKAVTEAAGFLEYYSDKIPSVFLSGIDYVTKALG